jgi:hypothetical protein
MQLFAIDVLASLMHPREGKWRNRFVVVESYMDESGIHDTAKICTVAGFYGTHAAWRKFEREWRDVLKKYDLENHGFHAKEFWGRANGRRVPPYDSWDDAKADKYIDLLIQVVMRNRIFPFGHGVVVAHWNAFSLEDRKAMTGASFKNGRFTGSGSPRKSYYLPFLFCVLDSLRNSGTNDKVHFFAGLDQNFSKYATALYKEVSASPFLTRKELFGTLAFPLSKDTPPLQAADLLVYQLYRHNVARFRGATEKPEILKRLLRNRLSQQRFGLFDTKELKAFMAMFMERVRKSGPPSQNFS